MTIVLSLTHTLSHHNTVSGLGAAAAGSAPSAALFFSTYEFVKPIITNHSSFQDTPPAVAHMTAASCGEVAACLVRVPTEVIKAKMQTSPVKLRLRDTIQMVLQEQHGSMISSITGGLYRGFGMTLFREIPFAALQFPMYERFKILWSDRQNQWVNPVQAAACGSLSGAIAGGITTPLDVIKTRTQVSGVCLAVVRWL